MMAKKRGRPTLAEQEAQILAFFVDLAEQDDDYIELVKFLLHIGIDSAVIDQAGGVIPAILDHYRFGRGYDVALLTHDMVRYPPIAARIRELRHAQRRKPKRVRTSDFENRG